MILKHYEINKLNFNLNKIILLYGKNEYLKASITSNLAKESDEVSVFEEKEILNNSAYFLENLLSKSLFSKNKLIIIKRSSDKMLNTIIEIKERNIEDITIIVDAESLEKNSKLRVYFEKEKELICIPFYPDNQQTLSKFTLEFLKEKKIFLSQSNINLIINKCSGDKETLLNELKKIESFCKNGNKITNENILKLINLSENHSIAELIDNCLAKNKKKTVSILNENNFNNDDCIMITRSFLIKAKKLLALSKTFETNKNIDLTISSVKPPIFWKEKEITKQQILKWSSKNIKQLIYSLSDTELQIKKNINNSINLITDFILFHSSSATNN